MPVSIGSLSECCSSFLCSLSPTNCDVYGRESEWIEWEIPSVSLVKLNRV